MTVQEPTAAAMWRQHYIEEFAKACVAGAEENERRADELRALAAKVLAPPSGTRVELSPDPYTVRFVTAVEVAA